MIKVVIERHIKDVNNLLPLLKELREAVVRLPGYLGGETLVGVADHSNVVVITNWASLKDWDAWAGSEERAKLYAQMEPLLVGPPRVTVYRHLSYRRAIEQGAEKSDL